MRTTKLFHTLASIEFFIIWCAFAVIGFVGGSLPGYIGGQSIMHFFEMKKYFENMPYETIPAMAKGKYEANVMPPYNKEDIMFYACMVNSKIRQGLRSIGAAIFLGITIALGFDWGILYILIAALCVFGITKIVQGSMDIL